MRTPARIRRGSFIDRYVFPDGELHELGVVVSRMQASGFEVRHIEGWREHYALTLRAWVQNLERSRDEAALEAGEARARIWRLYMAASALNFEAGRTQIHQVLAVKSDRGVRSAATPGVLSGSVNPLETPMWFHRSRPLGTSLRTEG